MEALFGEDVIRGLVAWFDTVERRLACSGCDRVGLSVRLSDRLVSVACTGCGLARHEPVGVGVVGRARHGVVSRGDVFSGYADWLGLAETEGAFCHERGDASNGVPIRYVSTWIAERFLAVAEEALDGDVLSHDVVVRLIDAAGVTGVKVRQGVQSTAGMLFAGNESNADSRAVAYMENVEDLKIVTTRFATLDDDLMIVSTFTAEATCGRFELFPGEGLEALLDLPYRFES